MIWSISCPLLIKGENLNNLVLKVSNIKKIYQEEILKDVSFEIKQGEKVAFVGLNGVGKTTTVNAISQVISVNHGTIKHFCSYATCFSSDFLPEYISIFELAKYRKMNITKLEELLNLFKIQQYKHTFIKYLSSGTKKKVELIFTLLKDVEFIILDEPTNALDFESVINLSNYIKNDPRTFLIVSHDFSFLDQFIKRIILLEQGIIAKDIIYQNQYRVDIVKIFESLKANNENIL